MDQKIGEGSFGQVCVVTHRLTGQRRACKRVAINTDMDRRLVETEIQLLKKLDHGNIMRLSECYVDGPSLYLISELCEGGTLLQGFARHGSEAQAAAAVRQILSATAWHRDFGRCRRLCPRWTVLVLVLSVEAVEAVTQTFHRPPVSSPLSRSEVLALRTAFSAKFGASSGSREPTDLSSGRRLLHGLPMRLTEQIRRDWQLVESDKVQQVKVSPGGPGEAVITWLTQDRRLPSLVEYQSARSVFSRTAQGEVNVYTTQICLPNSQVMADPLLGPPNIPLNYDEPSAARSSCRDAANLTISDSSLLSEELTKLLNTSSFLPPESDSWRFLGPNADPWEFLAKTNFCIDYKNPNAYYTSPYIHTVTLRGLGGSTDYSFRPAGSSRSFHFKTPPNAGANAAPMRLGVWADIGITNVSVMSKMLDLEPDLLVTVGDLSYADGWAERWDIFGMMMEPLMSSRYHLAVVGNHEIIQNNGVDFIHRYPMPFRQWTVNGRLGWSSSSTPPGTTATMLISEKA
eukprot:g31067.t1